VEGSTYRALIEHFFGRSLLSPIRRVLIAMVIGKAGEPVRQLPTAVDEEVVLLEGGRDLDFHSELSVALSHNIRLPF
jgi:hypothetical protein